jgi:hypothetical protein
MRWFFAFCLMLTLCAPPKAVAQTTSYLPRSAWADEEDWQFYEEWVGRPLRAFGEPSLSVRAAAGLVYRLLIVPSRRNPYVIRVTAHDDGSGEGLYVRPSFQGDTRKRFQISKERMVRLRRAFETANFMSLPREVSPTLEDGSDIVICSDGDLAMFEAVQDQHYHVVMYHRCGRSRGLEAMQDQFRDLAGIP